MDELKAQLAVLLEKGLILLLSPVHRELLGVTPREVRRRTLTGEADKMLLLPRSRKHSPRPQYSGYRAHQNRSW
jgi:hypothetical protein